MVLVASVAGPGCASLKAVTSGQIGCAEKDISISSDEQSWGTRTWTAHCGGRTYFCSGHGGGKDSAEQVSCKQAAEEVSSKIPAAAVSPDMVQGGCQYDSQCKGERICTEGKCVDPGAPPAAPTAPPIEASAAPPGM